MSSRQRPSVLARRAPSILIAIITAAAVLGACKTQPGSAGSAAAPVAYQNPGEVVYQDSCARCHGVYREGDGTSPALDSVRMASLGDSPLRMTISYGKGQMPGFGGLTPEQVEALINFLRGL